MARLRRNYRIYILIVLVFGLLFALGACITNFVQSSVETPPPPPVEEEEEEIIIDGDRTSILLMGLDARPGEDRSRSDSMILVTIDPKEKKAALISIPRDTRVDIRGSLDKICQAHYYGGPELACDVVSRLLRTRIDYYMVVDFNGFKKIIDTLGGVNMTVDQRMYYPAEGINLYPGEQRLNGYNALAFVRYRSYAMGDIQRTDQQQKFMLALADEVLKPSTVVKLPTLIRQANTHMETNLGLGDMLRMANWTRGFSAEDITTQTLPGRFYNIYDEHGALANSYWIVERNQAAGLLDRLFAGETIPVLSGVTATTRPPVREPAAETDDEEGEEGERTGLASPGHRDRTGGSGDGEDEDGEEKKRPDREDETDREDKIEREDETPEPKENGGDLDEAGEVNGGPQHDPAAGDTAPPAAENGTPPAEQPADTGPEGYL